MGIKLINIRNFKSLQDITLDFDRNFYDIQCIIGKNGTGKSNILDAINYFYKMSQNDFLPTENYTDSYNKYIQSMQIEFLYDLDILVRLNSNNYLDTIIKDLIPYVKNNKILLRFTQYKDGKVEWYPPEKDIRKNLSKLFPIYMIDTRFITLEDWSVIWDIISELSISNIRTNDVEINNKLDDILDEIYGKKCSKSLNKIESIFNNENITINKNNYNERFKNALYTRFGGSEFLSNSNKIDYYSDGTNSLKYIKMIVQLASLLSDTGWKNPLLIIDEPEIGLHPQYIDELVECFYQCKNSRVNILLTTHSANLVTSLIKIQLKVGLRRLFIKSNYTKLEKIRDLVEQNDKFLISNKETECYFANGILFVEGTTEMQLFQYPRLRELFNFIKYVKFFSCDSNDASLRLISPNNNKYNLPYIVLVDMDKIIKYSIKSKKFSPKPNNTINPLYSNEILKSQKLLYYNLKKQRKLLTHNTYQFLMKSLRKCTFEQNEALFWLDNYIYYNLKTSIKNYCLKYNVYPVNTTIEGCIINDVNYNIVKTWFVSFLKQSDIAKFDTLYTIYDDVYYKISVLRLILNGKLDNLLTLDEAKQCKLVSNNFVKEIKYFNNVVGDKTSGWIINFMDYYFSNYIDKIEFSFMKLNHFKKHFRELSFILQIAQDMVKSNYNE